MLSLQSIKSIFNTISVSNRGGKVAWTTVIVHPEMVERLVVISAPHPTAYKDPECFTSEQSAR